MSKRISVFFLVISFFLSSTILNFSPIYARSTRTKSSDVYVQGYYRKNGTYVQPYYRSKADGIIENNYSCIDDGRCGDSSAPVLGTTSETPVSDEPSFVPMFTPTPTPRPTLSPEELKAIKCSSEVKELNKKIKSEERIKFNNVTTLRKLVSDLNTKQASEAAELSEKTENYRLAYDSYTNKLYEGTWHACDENSSQYTEIRSQEKTIYLTLAPMRISARKLYSEVISRLSSK